MTRTVPIQPTDLPPPRGHYSPGLRAGPWLFVSGQVPLRQDGTLLLDRDLAETLSQRLRDTVAALCETALAPMALDEDALFARIERAVGMFSRADDERTIRLNPDDLTLISPRLAEDWQIVPDPALPRGALRVETASGGVEDGPAEWRRAIAEAMALC